MFPFLFNNNDFDFLTNIFNDDFINNIIDEILDSDVVSEDNYDIDFKDCGEYYTIKGYFPGLTAKDLSIDFDKNKAILTIKKRTSYSNNANSIMTVVSTGYNTKKVFYVDEIDVTNLKASFDNNFLVITMPKLKKLIKQGENNDNPEIIDVEDYRVE